MTTLSGQYHERYHILEQLGEGGMATVYKAYDLRLEREVAIKMIRRGAFPPDQLEHILARFEREAKSLARLSHPNIVKVYDFGEHDGSPFLVMEYLPGGTLKASLGHPIPWAEALRTLLPVARGLAFAHERGIIHRDVKPANIIISESGEPMLTDFGIAKLLEKENHNTLTGSGVGIGTPEYMAPEQGIGQTVDARSDIYSLGVVLYEMITGSKPYTADTPMAVVLKQISDPLPRPQKHVPDLPNAVEYLLVKAMAKKPEDRFENMGAMCKTMEELLNTASAPIPVPAPEPETPKPLPADPKTVALAPVTIAKKSPIPARRFPVKWLALLGAVLLIGGLAGFALLYRGKPAQRGAAALPPPTARIEATEPVRSPTARPVVSSATPRPSPIAKFTFTPAPTLDQIINLGQGERPLETQLLVGILKLEGTDQAITKEQAAALLPLWNDLKTLNRNLVPPAPGQNGAIPPTPVMDAAAQAQKDALIKQMLAVMTPEQMTAISGMKFTQETITSVMRENGIVANDPGGMPGTPSAGGPGSRQAGGGMMGDLIDALIQFLEKRAGA